MTKSLVFVSHRAPVFNDNGSAIRTYKLLEGLSESFRTTLVTFSYDPASPTGSWTKADLARRFPNVSLVVVPATFAWVGSAKRRAQLASLRSRRSWVFGRYDLPAFRRAVHDAVRDTRAAITHFNDFGVALSGPAPDTFNVYASHNVEHRVQRGMAEAAVGVRQAFAEIEWRRVYREEVQVWKEMDLCLAVSDLDAAAMRAAGARNVDICLVGTDPVPSYGITPRRANEPLRMLFVGSGNYQPNEHGVAWFVRNVFPRVRDAIPAVLDVVGSPPNHPVEAPGVSYRGYVDSLDEYYHSAHVAVVPVFFGSGTRGKIVEAMAYGTPVVSTTVGAEGLHVAPGQHYLRADTVDEFVSTLVGLGHQLNAPDEGLRAMASKAERAAARHFWPSVVDDLVARYRAAA